MGPRPPGSPGRWLRSSRAGPRSKAPDAGATVTHAVAKPSSFPGSPEDHAGFGRLHGAPDDEPRHDPAPVCPPAARLRRRGRCARPGRMERSGRAPTNPDPGAGAVHSPVRGPGGPADDLALTPPG